MLDDHTIGKVLETSQAELVLETTFGGRACVTRIFLRAVPLPEDAAVRDACLRGATLPDGLPGELLTYGAIAAGVSASVPRLVEPPPRGQGYAYVTVPAGIEDATVVDHQGTIAVPDEAPVRTIVVPDDPIPVAARAEKTEPSNSLLVIAVFAASGVIVVLSCAALAWIVLAR